VIPLAASQREAAPEQVRALWTDLLARLSLAAVAGDQTHARLQLRALGVRRTGTVATAACQDIMLDSAMPPDKHRALAPKPGGGRGDGTSLA